MYQLANFGFYHAIAHESEDGLWVALYDTRRSLRDDRTVLEADLLLESDGTGPEAAQRLLRDQLGLTPLEAWEPVTTRYGRGWRALFGSDIRAAA